MTSKKLPAPFLPLLAILGLVGLAYLPAPRLVAAWWPDRVDWLILATVVTAITFPSAYWLLKSHFANVEPWPYFVSRFDLILPALATFFILFALIAPLPRFATFFWGQTTTGIVQELQVERGVDLDQYYRVKVAYITAAGGQWTKDAYVGRSMFATLSAGDTVTIHYLSRFPHRGIIADQELMRTQARLLVWSMLLLAGWLAGTGIGSFLRTIPAPDGAKTAVPLLPQFALDTFLTEDDDPDLWTAVLAAHFPPPDAHGLHLPGLRFGVGCFAPDARLKMQPTHAVCFDRDVDGRIHTTTCPTEDKTDADDDPALQPLVPLRLLTIHKLPARTGPHYAIIISRPSANREQVVVYTAVHRQNGSGFGKTATWERHPDGSWHDTDDRLNWWIEGA